MTDFTEGLDEIDEAEYDAVMAELQHAGKLDPVPVDVEAGAIAAFMWRTIDAELAELTYDSLLDENALAGVRSTDASRLLTFEAPGLTVEVEAQSPPLRRLVGQVVPAQPGRLRVRHGGGIAETEVDEVGRFMVEGIPPGAVSLRFEADGTTVVTDWVII